MGIRKYGVYLLVIICMLSVSLSLINASSPFRQYYGNFVNSELIDEIGLTRKWKVSNCTVIYDDVPNFFLALDDTTIAREYYYVLSGNESTEFKYGPNSNSGHGGILHTYNIPQNFLGYIELNVLGNCTLQYMEINDVDSIAGYAIVDDISGIWNKNIFTMSTPTYGSVTLTDVRKILIFTGGPTRTGEGSYIDFIRVNHINNDMNDYYEIWDGSTLKYQGLIDPDINDFIDLTPENISYTSSDFLFTLILMLATFMLGIGSFRMVLFGLLGTIIGVITLFPIASTGNIIIGYSYFDAVATPIIEHNPILQILALMVIMITTFLTILNAIRALGE